MIRTIALVLALAAAMPAAAQVTAEQLPGTWECYGPGQTHPLKPPIVFFGELSKDDRGVAAIEVDAFSRAVVGTASVTAAPDGWTKVAAPTGQPVYVRNLATSRSKVSMQLRREEGGTYRCHRLPRFDEPMIPRVRTIQE